MGLFSSKKSSTTNQTTNQYYDQRSVVDAGGGIVGEGNAWDQSVNLLDIDASQRSFDNSDHSTTTTTINAIDGGAFELAERAQAGAMSFNEAAAARVFDLASSSQARAFESSGEALGFTRDTFADVLGLAGKVVDQAGSQAREASTVAAGAYSSAADTSSGNKTLIYAGLAVVGLVGAALLFKS